MLDATYDVVVRSRDCSATISEYDSHWVRNTSSFSYYFKLSSVKD